LLETVPESVTASPKMFSDRDAESDTEREFCATLIVPLNPLPRAVGSLYVNVPASAHVQDEVCDGCSARLQELFATDTWWATESLFVQLTESPLCPFVVEGEKPLLVMSTPAV